MRDWMWFIVAIGFLKCCIEWRKYLVETREDATRTARIMERTIDLSWLEQPYYATAAERWLEQERKAGTHRAVYDEIRPELSTESIGYNPGPGWEYVPYKHVWRRCRWVPL